MRLQRAGHDLAAKQQQIDTLEKGTPKAQQLWASGWGSQGEKGVASEEGEEAGLGEIFFLVFVSAT